MARPRVPADSYIVAGIHRFHGVSSRLNIGARWAKWVELGRCK
jgi:hypothetical protein